MGLIKRWIARRKVRKRRKTDYREAEQRIMAAKALGDFATQVNDPNVSRAVLEATRLVLRSLREEIRRAKKANNKKMLQMLLETKKHTMDLIGAISKNITMLERRKKFKEN